MSLRHRKEKTMTTTEPGPAVAAAEAVYYPQPPTICRMVHYVSYGTPNAEYTSECRAAVVTEVLNPGDATLGETVGLCVLNPTGVFFNRTIAHDEQRSPGSWHWPH